MHEHKPFLAAFFRTITDHPKITLALGLILIGITVPGLVRLHKDTSVDAFIPADHPSILANERTAEIFGLTDPIAVAVMSTDGNSIFDPETLTLLAEITERIAAIENIRSDRVASLTTESSIRGHNQSLLVDLYAEPPIDAAAAADAHRRWLDMPPHRSTLVARDESGAVIMAELIDVRRSADTYEAVRAAAGEALSASGLEDRLELLVAGPGAVSGYLSSYIDRDARILQPIVFLLIILFLYVAFRRPGALMGPMLVVVGAAGGAIGIMAWSGTAYFAITNALPVILVSISVADAIHILSSFYQLRARQPTRQHRELVVLTMTEMARPITLTTLTTIAGFFGIGFASIMPPIEYFAWYAALGVALAWVFSIIVLPAVIMLLNLRPSPAFRSWRHRTPDRLGLFFSRIGLFSIRRPVAVLTGSALLALLAGIGAGHLRIDRSQVENFAPDEPIRIADERINDAFAGTAFLDVLVETDEAEALLEPERMAKLAGLQAYMDDLPHMSKTVSIVDYLSLLHYALEEIPVSSERVLPDDEAAIAQYLLVYEASGDPTDLEEEIDANYQHALVRGVLDTPYFSESQKAVEQLNHYIENEFNEPGLSATLAGDVNVAYHWMSRLERSHFLGVGLSLALVLGMAMTVFRSVSAGLISVVPVSFTVLALYGVMGFLGINLEPATSMFAAISVGVGVDFAIHLVDRLRVALRLKNEDLEAAVHLAMPGTARACFFNASAMGVGFSVLLISDLPTLQRFGGLVSLATLVSFLSTLAIVPAFFAAAHGLRRRFLATGQIRSGARGTGAAIILAAGLTGLAPDSTAEVLDGLTIAERVAARQEGEAASRQIRMELSDQRGRTREREALVLKRYEDGADLTRITYLSPKSVRGVAFLSHDYENPDQADDRWLYLPAARKVRRIPASDRGDYFLGTDFTYEDVQSDLKFEVDDYLFHYEGTEESDGEALHQISGKPKNPQIAKELGYGAFTAIVSGRTWMPLEIAFSGLDGRPLKTIHVRDVRLIDGIWTAHEVEAVNHQTGHRTLFDYQAVTYPDSLPEMHFNPATLNRTPTEFAP